MQADPAVLQSATMLPRALGFLFLTVSLATLTAQQTVPREPFDAAYNEWRDSMMAKDLSEWKAATAPSRQMEVRNRIISAKGEFPTDLFASALQAPQLGQMTLLEIFVKGPTATAVYFGKADFGVSEAGEITDNLVVVNFLEASGAWKFDRLRVVKFGMDRETLLQVRSGDFSFLEGSEFQPSGIVPPTQPPIAKPDRIGEIWITAIGFEVTATVNRGNHVSQIANDLGKDLIIGGLKAGPDNHIALDIQSTTVAAGVVPHLEIAIYGAFNGRSPATRVFHYRPDPTQVPETFLTTFSVNN